MDIITKEGETPALFVNSITFNNGETIKINKNDIVELSVLIMLEKVNQHHKIVIKDIDLTFQNSDNDVAFIESCSTQSKNSTSGYIYIQV